MGDRVLFGRDHRYPGVVLPSHQAEKTTTQTSALPTARNGNHPFFVYAPLSCVLIAIVLTELREVFSLLKNSVPPPTPRGKKSPSKK